MNLHLVGLTYPKVSKQNMLKKQMESFKIFLQIQLDQCLYAKSYFKQTIGKYAYNPGYI
jgi:hypothetical protein